MRLRRTSAIAAIAAAVAATTAAVYPSAPADRLQPMPALTAPGLAARYTADAHQIARAASAASRAGNTGLAHSLDAMRSGQFLDFNPAGQGVAVEVFGNLATATRVAILVPGSDTSLTTFDSRGTASPEGAARALAAQARELDPHARLAVIAWLGYLTPSTLSPAVDDLGRRRAGRGRAAPVRERSRQARPSGRADLPQLRVGGLRPGRRAPAGDRHRGGRQPRNGRLLGARAAQHRTGVGGPGCRPGLESSTCRTFTSSGSASARTRWHRPSAPGPSPAAAAGTVATSGRAASPCATWPASRSVTLPG